MTTKFTLIALTSVLALGSAAASQNASAQTADAAVKVSYADLNISTAAGAKILLRRIHNVAGAICGAGERVPLEQQRAIAVCVKATTDQTVANVHAPVLTALNSDQSQSAPTDLASAR